MGLFDLFRRIFTAPANEQTTPSEPLPPLPAHGDGMPFPFPLITVHGSVALATWQRLREEGDGWPVVIGTDEDLVFIREGMEEIDERSAEDILAAAADLSFPSSLAAKREADDARAREWLSEQGDIDDIEDDEEVPLGDWPSGVTPNTFSVAYDVLTGRPHERVHIALLPCATGWEAIAHLRWGNWNENPAAEYHVAALRSWAERFGAELVSCSHDVIDLHVAARPATREAALAVAREHYLYCNDVVDQGTETLSGLAAVLIASDWWYFWWD